MVSPVLSESYRTGEFMVSEAPGTQSRGIVQFDNTAGVLDLQVQAGLVYSLAAYGTPVAANVAGIHGNGTLGTVTPIGAAAVPAMLGVYTVSFTGATTFNVLAPDGRELAPGQLGTAYADEIGFTAAAGGTAFQAGDAITVTLGAGTGYAVAYTGAAPAAGIIYNHAFVPAGGTKKLATIVRHAEVNAGELQWAPGLTAPQITAALAQLAAQGVIAR